MTNFLQASQNQEQLNCQTYQKADIKAGVIHLGVGAFHRAHQAVFFDRLLGHPSQAHWGIIGVNIRPQDSHYFEHLMAQDGEYILKTISAAGKTEYDHIRSLIRQIDGSKTPQQVDDAMMDPSIQLVTSTVTEGGYYLDENHQLMLDHPEIKADLSGERHTLYAFLYSGLKRRSQTSAGKITLLCCDNLRHNGLLLKTGLMQFVQAMQDTQLATWLEENVSFPCSMVDRITPKPSSLHMDDVNARFGLNDTMTVMGEDFIQWVVEDNFAGEKPPLETVGVQVVENVEPFEEAKIRILNAGHTCITYQAALKGLTYFDQAMKDTQLSQYFSDFIEQDVIPAIGESVVDLPSYANTIAERFSNDNIGDTIERICSDGYAKFPVFVFPTLLASYQNGHTPNQTLKGIASWYCFLQAVKKEQIAFSYHEPSIAELSRFSDDQEGVEAFVSHPFLWGEVIEKHPQFKEDLTKAIMDFNQSLA